MPTKLPGRNGRVDASAGAGVVASEKAHGEAREQWRNQGSPASDSPGVI